MTARSLRRAARFALLAVAGASLAGCGGGSSAVGTRAAPPSDPPITKAQAATYARAINLKATDLPQMTVTKPEAEAPPSPSQLAGARCAGNPNPDLMVATINSARFAGVAEPEHEEIYSGAEVWRSAALAARNNAASQSRRFIACAEKLVPRLLATSNGSRVHYGPPTITRLPNHLPGIPGSYGIRITVPILGVPSAIEPAEPHLYIDAFSFLSGPAEVNLLADGFPQPVGEEAESRLLSLLYSRAQATKL